jgi:hypothetical protein
LGFVTAKQISGQRWKENSESRMCVHDTFSSANKQKYFLFNEFIKVGAACITMHIMAAHRKFVGEIGKRRTGINQLSTKVFYCYSNKASKCTHRLHSGGMVYEQPSLVFLG